MRRNHAHTHLPRRQPLAPDRQSRSEFPIGKRRAALIASLVTLPIIIVFALALAAIGGNGGKPADDGPLPPLTPAAPPNIVAEAAPCTKVIENLPVQLKSLSPRVVRPKPATPFVVAWGDPAIVLRCGVDKPKNFGPKSTRGVIDGGGADGAFYWVDGDKDGNVFTAIDRAAYVSFEIPSKYQGGDYTPILNAAVLKAMPTPVCSTSDTETDLSKLCTRRK